MTETVDEIQQKFNSNRMVNFILYTLAIFWINNILFSNKDGYC